ncbi:hypothetical protein DFH06DRAFT_1318521 [Mycena polygramma]|nr:hypothetical protein DFH06DRAFT_1318521 [Mycena polygramma]
MLWNSIYISRYTRIEQLQISLIRSGGARLAIHLHLDFQEWTGPDGRNHAKAVLSVLKGASALFRHFIAHSNTREETLYILAELTQLAVPELECLDLWLSPLSIHEQLGIPPIFAGSMPCLRSLIFHHSWFPLAPAASFRNVLHLSLDHIHSPERDTVLFFEFLSALPQLESLNLGRMSFEAIGPGGGLIMPCLDFDFQEEECIPDLLKHLSHVIGQISRFALGGLFCGREEMRELFACLPAVSVVDFGHMMHANPEPPHDTVADYLIWIAEGRHFFPQLSRMILPGSDAPTVGILLGLTKVLVLDGMSGVNDLPPEVLSRTMRFYLGIFFTDQEHFDKRRRVLTQVCRQWRAVCTGDCLMWNEIFVTSRHHLDCLRQTLVFSKQARLTIVIVIFDLYLMGAGGSRQQILEHAFLVMKVLAAAFLRCWRLFVTTVSVENTQFFAPLLNVLRAPMLEYLELGLEPDCIEDQRQFQPIPLPFGGRIDSLQSFTFSQSMVLWEPAPFYSGLRQIHFDAFWTAYMPTFTEIHAILECITNLKSLVLNYVDFVEPPADSPRRTIALNRLTHLDFGANDETAAIFIATLHMPLLHTLDIHFDEESFLPVFLTHCSTLLSQITTFAIGAIISCGDDIRTALQCLDRATYLDLTRISWTNTIEGAVADDTFDDTDGPCSISQALHEIVKSGGRICPRLDTLLLNDVPVFADLIYDVLECKGAPEDRFGSDSLRIIFPLTMGPDVEILYEARLLHGCVALNRMELFPDLTSYRKLPCSDPNYQGSTKYDL